MSQIREELAEIKVRQDDLLREFLDLKVDIARWNIDTSKKVQSLESSRTYCAGALGTVMLMGYFLKDEIKRWIMK